MRYPYYLSGPPDPRPPPPHPPPHPALVRSGAPGGAGAEAHPGPSAPPAGPAAAACHGHPLPGPRRVRPAAARPVAGRGSGGGGSRGGHSARRRRLWVQRGQALQHSRRAQVVPPHGQGEEAGVPREGCRRRPQLSEAGLRLGCGCVRGCWAAHAATLSAHGSRLLCPPNTFFSRPTPLQLHSVLLQRALKPGRATLYAASAASVPVAVREAAFTEAADCFCALLGRAEVSRASEAGDGSRGLAAACTCQLCTCACCPRVPAGPPICRPRPPLCVSRPPRG